MISLNPENLAAHEREFAAHIGLPLSADGCRLERVSSDHLRVERHADTVTVYYGRLCELYRGIALLKEGLQEGETLDQPARMDTLCAFCDCSRNAVMHVDMIRSFVMDIAALGFNQLQLYTEDTYEVKDYPYFGHLRGRYTREEIRQADEFAALFGIELVPAVQTLAHLNGIFRWNAFEDIHDTTDILLCDEDKTYAFIDSLVASLRGMYSTDKINIGLDEAHMVGLGKYLMKHGYQPRMELFLRHINRVVEILRKYDFRPMMWSDMFFKLATGRTTYDTLESVEFDRSVLELIPPEMSLVYWDYSTISREHYDQIFDAHKAMGKEIWFAGGFRKWVGFCPATFDSFRSSRIALESAIEHGIRHVIVTGWGDDGAEAATYMLLPGLTLYAEKCYTDDMSDGAIDRRLRALYGYGLEEFGLLARPNLLPEERCTGDYGGTSLTKSLLFNDPLLGMYDRHIPEGAGEWYAALAEKLAVVAAREHRLSYVFETICELCRVLEVKSELGNRIRDAYRRQDREAMAALCDDLRETVRRLDAFHEVFRRNWRRENKIFGFDTQDIRIGALRARLVYAIAQAETYSRGEIDRIEEMDQPCLYMDCRDENDTVQRLRLGSYWKTIATPSVL